MSTTEWSAYALATVAVYGLARLAIDAFLLYRQDAQAKAGRVVGRMAPMAGAKLQTHLMLLIGIVGALVTLVATGSLLLTCMIVVACMVAPRMLRTRARAKRLRLFEEQFPDALALLSSTLRAGISMPLAVAKVSDESPAPLSEEFGLLKREIQLGRIEQGFQELSERIPMDSVKLFVTAVVTCVKMGGNLAEMSDSIAQTIRNNIELRGELRTLTAEGRMQGVMMALMPFLVVGLIAVVNPDMVSPLFTHWVGNLLIVIVLVLEAIGVLIIREMLKIED